ncbi:solute-binding protein [Pseudoduganella sp. DS3]|uniref:Solute-binding protein n=1 Tax=Pseudoduganella guangdongensis TaxID=2692179 RepID=A0A6N9HJL6_9BURK|nr:substrate-binding domain-containing protein [Pseudoduganella guangdongensis]MYN03680.1 solute-binding protein [Pseudoduganella guangdongensis]
MGFVFVADAVSVPPLLHSARLHIAGSTTMGPLLREIAAKYRLLHPEVAIEVELGGSLRGLEEVRAGHAHIAMLSRALAPGEHDLYGIPIARDGLGVVVHTENPMEPLDFEQLQAIFSGRMDAFHVVAAQPGSASNALLARFLRQPLDTFKPNAAVESDIERMAVVASCENAISFVSIGAAERAIAQGVSIRLLPVSGVSACMANIRNGSYPICRSLTLVSKEPPLGIARSFFAFCLSAQVNGILSAFDFVPYLD